MRVISMAMMPQRRLETCVRLVGYDMKSTFQFSGELVLCPIRYHRARFGAAIVVAFLCGLVFASGFDLTHFGWAQSRVDARRPSPRRRRSPRPPKRRPRSRPSPITRGRPSSRSRRERFAKTASGTAQRRAAAVAASSSSCRRASKISSSSSTISRRAISLKRRAAPASSSPNDGYILTNNHVVADADKVTVTLFDKRVFETPRSSAAIRRRTSPSSRSTARTCPTLVARRRRQGARRPVGAGDRQSAAAQLHRDGGHRQRQGPQPVRRCSIRAATTRTRSPTTSRRTRRSTRATRAVRCSTSAAT